MNKGFTLAEVLITLGVIGVVAVLTISTLTNNIQEKFLLTQLSHVYSLMSQATEKMIEDEKQDIKFWGSNGTERMIKFQELLPKYLKVVKTCDLDRAVFEGCNAKTFKWLMPDGSIYIDRFNTINNRKTFVLVNGVSVMFPNEASGQCGLYKNFTYDGSYTGAAGGTYGFSCFEFFVDINGKKGPNEIDKDIFLFWLGRDGLIPAGMPQEDVWSNRFEDACGKNATNPYALHNCTAWALQNKNMDYLKCGGLSWHGKHSCKDLK